MTTDFAPRGIGAILDGAVELYRRDWKPLMAVSLAIVGPAALILSIAQVFYMRGYLEIYSLLDAADIDTVTPASFQRFALIALVSQAVTPVYSLAVQYVTAAVYRAGPALQQGAPVGFRGILRVGLRRFIYFVVVGWISGLVSVLVVSTPVVVGFLVAIVLAPLAPWTLAVTLPLALALAVPGTVVMARLSLAPIAVMLEGQSIPDAFRRSWRLTRVHWGRVVLFWIAFSIVNFALQGALNSPAAIRQLVDSVQDPQAIFRELSVGWKVFEGLLSASSVSIALPFSGLAWYLFYVDMRARAEGMDLVARARSITRPVAERA